MREKARELRAAGRTYPEIMAELDVAKGTLSGWCKGLELGVRATAIIKERRQSASRVTRAHAVVVAQTRYWNQRLSSYAWGRSLYEAKKNETLFVAGLMCYWAEGTKGKNLTLANSDERMQHLFLRWLETYFELDRERNIVLHLHIHSGQDELVMKRWWSKELGVPITAYYPSYTKPEGTGHRRKKLYRGTITVRVCNTSSVYLLYSIFGAIDAYLKSIGMPKRTIESWVGGLKYAVKNVQ